MSPDSKRSAGVCVQGAPIASARRPPWARPGPSRYGTSSGPHCCGGGLTSTGPWSSGDRPGGRRPAHRPPAQRTEPGSSDPDRGGPRRPAIGRIPPGQAAAAPRRRRHSPRMWRGRWPPTTRRWASPKSRSTPWLASTAARKVAADMFLSPTRWTVTCGICTASSAAAVVAHGHPPAAGAADLKALQQRGSLSGWAVAAVAAVGGGQFGQAVLVGLVLGPGDVAGCAAVISTVHWSRGSETDVVLPPGSRRCEVRP